MNLAPSSIVKQKNRLLAAMSSDDFALLEPMLKPLALNLRQMLEPANKPIKHNYFITSGLASVIAIGKTSHRLEVGIIGCDGMTGLPVVLGMTAHPMRPSFKLKALARASRRMVCAKPCEKAHR